MIQQILQDISVYAAEPDGKLWVLAVKGEPGSGKSLFIRNLIQQVLSNERMILKARNESVIDEAAEGALPNEIQFKIIVTSSNAIVEKRFIGIWIPVLREMITIYSKTQNKRIDHILNTLIKNSDVEDSKLNAESNMFT